MSTPALVPSALSESTRLFYSHTHKSFSDLPDDVLLEIFTCIDFSSIMALRQTCRKCYHLSKTAALWRDVHQWITQDAEDWRAPLAESSLTLPSDALEKAVTRLVRFERNWSQGRNGVQRTALFDRDDGYVSTLIPGGRWFLASTRTGIRGVTCYDLDAQYIERQMLITQTHQHQLVWAIDSAIDNRVAGFEFDLAVEFITRDHFNVDCGEPRDLTIWRVSLGKDDRLSAKLVHWFPVFRATPSRYAISLAGDFLLRMSLPTAGYPVFTVHRWRTLSNDKVTHSILIPMREEMPGSDIRLLPDGRILSISHSWVEIYAPPDHQWEESLAIPTDIPRSAPWWVYEYTPPLYRPHHAVSQLVHAQVDGSVTFSIHNGERLFSFRIPPRGELEPKVASTMFAQLGPRTNIGLGTSRAIISYFDETKVTFVTLDYRPGMGSLRTFAGVPPGNQDPKSRNGAAEARFYSPYPSMASPWLIDEKSGRVVCRLTVTPDHYTVFYFVD